jgi:hypothetical protein
MVSSFAANARMADKWYLSMRLSIGIVGLALLTGCVSVKEVSGPDGKPALAVKCGDATLCYQKAGELCPGGYDFVNSSTGTVIVPTAQGGSIGSPQTTILVECKSTTTSKN